MLHKHNPQIAFIVLLIASFILSACGAKVPAQITLTETGAQVVAKPGDRISILLDIMPSNEPIVMTEKKKAELPWHNVLYMNSDKAYFVVPESGVLEFKWNFAVTGMYHLTVVNLSTGITDDTRTDGYKWVKSVVPAAPNNNKKAISCSPDLISIAINNNDGPSSPWLYLNGLDPWMHITNTPNSVTTLSIPVPYYKALDYNAATRASQWFINISDADHGDHGKDNDMCDMQPLQNK